MTTVIEPDLAEHPAWRELHQLVCELGLISHAGTQRYDGDGSKQTTPAKNEIGGKRPPGSDTEYPPRRPREPIEPAESASDESWRVYHVEMAAYAQALREYHDERQAWATSYQRRSVQYFRDELERCGSIERLTVLRDQARATVDAWRKSPMGGVEPLSRADPKFKRWVAESKLPTQKIADRYGCSVRYVQMIRKQFRQAYAPERKTA